MDEGDLGEEAFGNAEGIEEEKEDLFVSEKAVSYEEEHKEEIAELDKGVIILEPEKAMGAENAEERSYIFEPEKASSNVEENEEQSVEPDQPGTVEEQSVEPDQSEAIEEPEPKKEEIAGPDRDESCVAPADTSLAPGKEKKDNLIVIGGQPSIGVSTKEPEIDALSVNIGEVAIEDPAAEHQETSRPKKEVVEEVEIPENKRKVEVPQRDLEALNGYHQQLEEMGILAAYENAIMMVGKKGPRPSSLREFVAKEFELFGRRWNSGVVNKNRYTEISTNTRKRQRARRELMYKEIKQKEMEELERKRQREEEERRRREEEAQRIAEEIRGKKERRLAEEKRLERERELIEAKKREEEKFKREEEERLKREEELAEQRRVEKEQEEKCQQAMAEIKEIAKELVVDVICEVDALLQNVILKVEEENAGTEVAKDETPGVIEGPECAATEEPLEMVDDDEKEEPVADVNDEEEVEDDVET